MPGNPRRQPINNLICELHGQQYTTYSRQCKLRDRFYNAALQPVGEDLPDTFFGDDRDLTRQYETGTAGSGVWPGRPTGLRVEPIGGGTDEYATDWHYDATTGRLERITGSGLPSAGTDPGVNYSYLANSEYVEKIELRHDDNVILRTTRQYETTRDLIDFVHNEWVEDSTSTTISKYDYTNDDLARRSGVEHTGAAFSASQELSHGYNERNELTQTDREVSGEFLRRWSYAYDAIGNRVGSADTIDPEGLDEVKEEAIYARNALNQYPNVGYYGEFYGGSSEPANTWYAFDLDGSLIQANASADMNCDGVFNNFDIDNFVTALLYPSPTEHPDIPSGVTYSGGENCWDQRVTRGDVNGDGVLNNFDSSRFGGLLANHAGALSRRFEWDAENRLVRVRPTPDDGDLSSAWNAAQKVEFRYDYMGRRVEKAVYEWDATGEEWDAVSKHRYVYDGWNLIQELNVPTSGDPTVLRQYTWGLDLSGQNGSSTVGGLHGAGGIGGLLSVYDTNGTTTGENATSDDHSYAYLYDANGNVGQLAEWASAAGGASGMAWSAGRLAAKYEYDPYGNITGPDADGDGNIAEESGPYAAINPFRFSTKFLDPETGLYYYGYRYYSPRLGRWISRDPIETAAPYIACQNNLFYYVDPDGRQSMPASAPATQPTTQSADEKSSPSPGTQQPRGTRGGAKVRPGRVAYPPYWPRTGAPVRPTDIFGGDVRRGWEHVYGNCCGSLRDCSSGMVEAASCTDEACKAHDICYGDEICGSDLGPRYGADRAVCDCQFIERLQDCHAGINGLDGADENEERSANEYIQRSFCTLIRLRGYVCPACEGE
ncbi:MAG: hypothetical protein IPM64_10790 [Phycisphaerales bacterium]|nr:hypothetical protein [Phycisphaerales bacterium]